MTKRWWEWEPVFELAPDRAALVVVDMQNGFVNEGSPLEVPMAAKQVGVIAETTAAAREHGLPIVFTRFCVEEGFSYDFYWRIAEQRGLHLGGRQRDFAPESHEAQIVPELEPGEDDVVLEKCGYDAFSGTELDVVLQREGRDQLVVCGTVVNWCVDSTVRAAFHRGYQVAVLADAVSGYEHGGLLGETWVDAELDLFAEAFGRVISTQDFRSALDRKLS